MTLPTIANRFTDTTLLTVALTHKSYCNEHPAFTSNERLEFLGDSVLSLLISTRLFKLLPDQPEGELTARRSYIVQTTSLAQKSIELGLDKHILMSVGEEESGGRSNPSVLANTFEATLAALYLAEGLDACEAYLNEVFPDAYLVSELPTKDPKSLLQEKAQSQGLGTPTYTTIDSYGPDHAKQFTIAAMIMGKQISQATGPSKQKAESEAAKLALAKLFPS
jgi:ribonuclease-3